MKKKSSVAEKASPLKSKQSFGTLFFSLFPSFSSSELSNDTSSKCQHLNIPQSNRNLIINYEGTVSILSNKEEKKEAIV